jgi:hypothetical protein
MAYAVAEVPGSRQLALNLPKRRPAGAADDGWTNTRGVRRGALAQQAAPRGQQGAPRGQQAAPRGQQGAPRGRQGAPRGRQSAPLCAGCRQNEARYGFRVDGAEAPDDRPRTLCFTCFRVELDYRHAVAARLARGWNAEQVRLPLDDTLRELSRRRRRAQIAARHALGE